MNQDERRALLTQAFVERFGQPPSIWVRAPGRVDLMGSHTDYNLGYVLTLPIDRDTWIAARPRADRIACVQSLNAAGSSRFDVEAEAIAHDKAVPWANYVRGVASVFQA